MAKRTNHIQNERRNPKETDRHILGKSKVAAALKDKIELAMKKSFVKVSM